ncbi:hypothetical protein EON65_14085 [archaeon]|nr:MAG: hypothetical protein EON65_14085 [archaeon]
MNFKVYLVFIAVITLWACGKGEPRAKDAAAILHVGPHKTGSTYLQIQLHGLSRSLAAIGYCVNGNESSKEPDKLARMLWSERNEYGFYYNYTHIHECILRKEIPILSSETFSIFNKPDQFRRLKAVFRNASTHVIIVYREPLQVYHSIFTQISKPAKAPKLRFTDYVFDYYHMYGDAFHYKVIDNYVSAYGRDNVTIIDYDGVQSAQKDILLVTLCEIIGIMCDVQSNALKIVNKRPDMLPHHIYLLVRNYMFTMGCQFATNISPGTISKIIARYSAIVSQVPKKEANLGMLRQMAAHMDTTVRERYGGIMLYNNASAAAAARASLKVWEVDEVAFMASSTWSAWLRKEGFKWAKERIVINCSANVAALSREAPKQA